MSSDLSERLHYQHLLVVVLLFPFPVVVIRLFVFNLRCYRFFHFFVVRDIPEPSLLRIVLPVQALNRQNIVEAKPSHFSRRSLHLLNTR